jgi:pentatricopeptide repeat protein
MATEDDIMPLLGDRYSPRDMTYIQGLFDFCDSNGIVLTSKSYSKLISHFGRHRNVKMIDRALLHCGDRGVVPDTVLMNSVIDAYIRSSIMTKAGAVFTNGVQCIGSSLDIAVLLSRGTGARIHSDGSRGSVETASAASLSKEDLAILDYFKSYSVKVNTRSFNTMLKGIRHQPVDGFELSMKLYLEMLSIPAVKPDSVTLNTVIDAAVSLGYFEAAEKLLFKTRGTEPGVEAYTSLLSGYAKRGLVDNAFRVYGVMEDKGIAPTDQTLTALMSSCLKARKSECAKNLLRALDAEEDEWHQRETAARGYNDDDDDGDCTYTLMNTNGTDAQTQSTRSGIGTINIVQDSLLRIKRSRTLTATELSKLHGSYVIGLCGLANTALTAYEQERMIHAAQSHLLRMEDRSIAVDVNTANAFIQALCSTSLQRIGDACAVFAAMPLLSIVPDKYTYSIIFSALGRAGYIDEAVQIYNSVDSMSLDSAAVNAMLRALVESSTPLDAVRFYYDLQTKSHTAGHETSTHMQKGDQKRVSKVGNNSTQQYIHPRIAADKVTYSVLFLACLRSLKELSPRTKNDAEVHREQPMAYDAESGRFYEVYKHALYAGEGEWPDDAREGLSEGLPLPFARRVASQVGTGRDTSQGMKGKTPQAFLTGLKAADSKAVVQKAGMKPRRLDEIVQGIYREMRFGRRVKPDERMVHTLNHLFDKAHVERKSISRHTAALIFEDLVICGYNPEQLEPILACCEYPDRYKHELMYDEGRQAVKRLRRSATSNQLFKKYQWNDIKSGWAPIF